MSIDDFDRFMTSRMPSFIAINYQRLLEVRKAQERVNQIVHVYELVLRFMTITLISQYLLEDRSRVNDADLNNLLLNRFPSDSLTLDVWQGIFFTTFEVYVGKAKLLFMPELYGLYWDDSNPRHERRETTIRAFERLTQVAVEIQAETDLPTDEAEWSNLATEITELLRIVLRALAFLGKYELIRVLGSNESSYWYELHQGMSITAASHSGSLSQRSALKGNDFYLRKEPDMFLALHPLLVFWRSEPDHHTLHAPATGIYDRLFYDEQMQYLLAQPFKTVLSSSDRLVKDFLLLLSTLDKLQGPGSKLTWLRLQEACTDVTYRRMATVRGKYRQELYLDRSKTHQEFERFLQSNKRCFVLIGKSGVGKSNFLLATGEELRLLHRDVCVLMYDGANVNVEKTMTGVIAQDVADYLRRPVQDLWSEVAEIDGIQERTVFLIVDAINENPGATKLLEQLNELTQSAWPWLKIVFTCRPETWRTIKRGVKLAEAFFYRGSNSAGVEVELEPFSYSDRMEDFTRQELPLAYAKYQREYNLQSPYESLSPDVRDTLREPLNLWMVAKTYANQAIPTALRMTELVENYLDALVDTGRLQEEDLELLVNRLVPLMIRERPYRNEITAADLTSGTQNLHLLVNSAQVRRDGRPINQSFINLLEADILVRQQQGREQKIAFKYERFYEYFVGREIVRLNTSQTNRLAYFVEMIKATETTPFLWGAVRDALVQEVRGHGTKTLGQLCFTENQRVKEMLVDVLLYIGRDEVDLVNSLLRQLMPPGRKTPELRKLRQVIHTPTPITDPRTRNAHKIAIEVASQLKLDWVLRTAALHTDPTMRALAVRFGYHLWKRNHVEGFDILEAVAEDAASGLVPNFMAFESVVGLSVIIFGEHYHDQAVLSRLHSIWRLMIGKLFRVRNGHTGRDVLQAIIRESVISFGITLVFRLFRELPDYNVVSYSKIEAFFHLGSDEKALYGRLVGYINTDEARSASQWERDYRAAMNVDNVLFMFVTLMGFIAEGCATSSSLLALLPFLSRLFEEARRDVRTYHALADIANIADNLLVCNPKVDELFDFFVYAVMTCQEYETQHPQVGRNRTSNAPETRYLGPYVFHQYRKTGEVRTQWFESRIQSALSRNDTLFFDLLISVELPFVAFERQEPRAALAALELIFKRGNSRIDQMIMTFLARLRVYYADEVDDFLEEQHAPDDFRLQVRTNEPVERVGDLVGQRSLFFIRDSVLLGSAELRSQLQLLFGAAADCKNTRMWMSFMIRHVVNLMYGGQVLHQRAVSKGR